MKTRTAHGSRGFTLLELLTVMVIMALLMSGALAAYFTMGQGARVRGAVSNLQSTLSLARQRAILKQQALEVRFDLSDPEAVSYRVWSPNEGAEGSWIGEKVFLPGGVAVQLSGDFTGNKLTFTPAGNGGFDTATVTLSDRNGVEQWTLTVYGLTGLVKAEETTSSP